MWSRSQHVNHRSIPEPARVTPRVLTAEQFARRAGQQRCPGRAARHQTCGPLEFGEGDVGVLLGLQRDPDHRQAACERGLHAALTTGGDGEIHLPHDLVAGQHSFNHDLLVLEIAQVMDGRRDQDPGAERSQCRHDLAHQLRRAGGDGDVDDGAGASEELPHPAGDGHAQPGVEGAGVAQPGARTVAARVAWRPRPELPAGDAEQLRDVGDQGQVAEQQRGEARHALDPEVRGYPVEAGRVDREPFNRGVELPLPHRQRQPVPGRHPRQLTRQRQQATLEHGRQERPRMVGDQRNPGQPRQQQRGEHPPRHGHPDLVRAEVRRLGPGVAAQFLVSPHALIRRADAGQRRHECRAPGRAHPRADQVIGDPRGEQLPLVRAAVGGDTHVRAPRPQGPVDLQNPEVSDRKQQFGSKQIMGPSPAHN